VEEKGEGSREKMRKFSSVTKSINVLGYVG
jgi:hypothetical protein